MGVWVRRASSSRSAASISSFSRAPEIIGALQFLIPDSVAQAGGVCHAASVGTLAANGLDSKHRNAGDIDRSAGEPQLHRSLSLPGAVALNMLDMIGVGPFITLPLILAAMGGPQAMLGWILGAGLALCDGLVWAELGAAMPEAGGSYAFLRTDLWRAPTGRRKLGRFLAFLFIFQLTFSAPLSVASGCIGLSQYAAYLLPWLGGHTAARTLHWAATARALRRGRRRWWRLRRCWLRCFCCIAG